MDKLIEQVLYSLEAMAEDAEENGNGDRARLLTTCSRILREEIERLDSESCRMRAAIRQTLEENGHLADGDNCTLILLKRALEAPNA